MLQFKGEESVARAIRHFMHQTYEFVSIQFDDVIEHSADANLRDAGEKVISDAKKEFWSDIQKLSDQVEEGHFAIIDLVPITAQERYQTFVKNLAQNLYRELVNIGGGDVSLDAFTEFIARLSVRNTAEFILVSRSRQADRLQKLMETKTLSAWYSVFQVEEWQEKHLKDGIEQVIETIAVSVFEKHKDVLINTDDQGDVFARVATSELTHRAENQLESDLIDSLRHQAETKLVANDDQQTLKTSIIPEVVSKKVDRLHKFTRAFAEEVVYDYVESTPILEGRAKELF